MKTFFEGKIGKRLKKKGKENENDTVTRDWISRDTETLQFDFSIYIYTSPVVRFLEAEGDSKARRKRHKSSRSSSLFSLGFKVYPSYSLFLPP